MGVSTFYKPSTLEDALSVLRVKVYPVTIIILYILPLIPIWYFDYLPIQDYPRHLAGIKVLREYYNNSFLQEHFSVDFFRWLSPIPNVAFELFATKVCFFLDINTTGKLFISIYVMLFVLSLYLLSRELKMNYADVLLMSLPLVYSSYLYMGFLNFIFSIPIFLVAIWCYLCAKREEKYLVFLWVVSIFLYLSHLFVFAMFLFFIFIDVVMSYRRLSGRFILLIAGTISIPLFFSINYIMLSEGNLAYYHPGGISYKIIFTAFPFLYFSIWAGMAMFFCYIYTLLVAFYGSSVINRVFLAAVVSYFLLYIVLPFGTMKEGSFVDVRAIAFGMVLIPFAVKIEENRYKIGIFSLIVLLTIINTSVAWFSFSRFQREMSPALACLRTIDDKSRLLPVAIERGMYFIGEPYVHAWGYAFLDNDFITPDFSSTFHHILKYKEKPYTPPDDWYLVDKKRSPLEKIERHYDYIAIFGSDESVNNRIGQIGTKVCEGGILTLYGVNK